MFFSCFLSGRFISVTCGTNFFSEKRKSRPEHAAKTLFQSGFLGKSGGGRPKKTQCLRKLLCITDFTSFQHGGGIIQHIVHQHFVSTKPPRLGGRDASATLPAPPFPLPSPFISPLQMGERWDNDGRTMGQRAGTGRERGTGTSPHYCCNMFLNRCLLDNTKTHCNSPIESKYKQNGGRAISQMLLLIRYDSIHGYKKKITNNNDCSNKKECIFLYSQRKSKKQCYYRIYRQVRVV